MAFSRQFSELKVFETIDPAVDILPPAIVIPAGERWRIQGLTFSLNSSATAGNRVIWVGIDRGSGTPYLQFISSGYLQPASRNTVYNFGPGAGYSSAVGISNTLVSASLPVDFALESGWRININSEDLQAGDNFSKVILAYELLNTGA